MRWIAFSLLTTLFIALLVFIISIEKADAPTLAMPELPGKSGAPTTTPLYAFPESKPAPRATKVARAPSKRPVVTQKSSPATTTIEQGTEVTRIQNPYPFPPLSSEIRNTATRASLVNIICSIKSNGTAQSVTGSGVIIDPRGIVLTNAHVGQYVLLSEVAANISCLARTGAPATPKWRLRIMYIPSKWVDEHAKDLRIEHPTGTGEHDYALLLAEPLDAESPPVVNLPALPPDTREAIAFEGDEVLLGSYPAGFLGSSVLQNDLYPATTVTTIARFYTFTESLIDLLSLGGVIVAQGGSSGGAVVNRWGRLVGIITTTSDGATTAERDLRAITLAHIDRSVREHTGRSLADIIGSDAQDFANEFRTQKLPELAQKLIDQFPH